MWSETGRISTVSSKDSPSMNDDTLEAEELSMCHSLGGDVVLTERELRSTRIFKSGEVARPVLGLNCVGGESSSEMCKALGQEDGTFADSCHLDLY